MLHTQTKMNQGRLAPFPEHEIKHQWAPGSKDFDLVEYFREFRTPCQKNENRGLAKADVF
jgi:hypothetical protein